MKNGKLWMFGDVMVKGPVEVVNKFTIFSCDSVSPIRILVLEETPTVLDIGKSRLDQLLVPVLFESPKALGFECSHAFLSASGLTLLRKSSIEL